MVQTIAGRKHLGSATAMNSLARSTGGASGATLFGALIFSQIPGANSRSLPGQASTMGVEAVVHEFHNGYLAAALVAALGAYTARRMPRMKLWVRAPAERGEK